MVTPDQMTYREWYDFETNCIFGQEPYMQPLPPEFTPGFDRGPEREWNKERARRGLPI